MILLIFAIFSQQAVIGIDYGNQYIKVSMAIAGKKVFVALNQNAKRLSPSYFSFWNTKAPQNTTQLSEEQHWDPEELSNYSWAFFDSGKSHALKYPEHSVTGFTPIFSNIHGFTRREVLAITLRNLLTSIEDGKYSPDNAKFVFAVEPFITREERFAISEAIELANASTLAIIDYPTAAAQLYALEKRGAYAKKEKLVAFIDIGATNSWASVYKFVPSKRRPTAIQLSLATRHNFGGQNIDLKLANLLLSAYREKYYVGKSDDEFSRICPSSLRARFIEEARKAKEQLTINKEVEIRMDDIEDDKSLSYTFTRDTFNSLISDFKDELLSLYKEAVDKADISIKNLDSTELIGSVTRIPLLKDALINACSENKIDRTMNSEEAIVLGAGYVGATRSSAFIVKDVDMKSFANINVSFIHNNTVIPIFNESSYLDETFKYSFSIGDVCNVSDVHEVTSVIKKQKFEKKKNSKEKEIVYEDENVTDYYIYSDNFSIAVNDKIITTFYLQFPNGTRGTAKSTITIGFSDLSIPNLTQIRLRSSLYDLSNAHFIQPSWSLSPEQFEQSFNFIQKMESIIKERKEFQQAFNDYESYIFTIKDKVLYNEEFQNVITEEEGKEFINEANEHRKWLDENMFREDLTKDEIKKEHDKLKNVVKDAERREEHVQKVDEYIEKYNKSLNWMYKELTETWPKKKKWMPRDKLRSAWKNYNSSKKWFNDMIEQQKGKKDNENPAAWWNQFNMQRQIMEFNFNQTARTKKPTPTPVGYVPPEPEIDIEEQERREEEEERFNELENEHHEIYRTFLDATHDFFEQFHALREFFNEQNDKISKWEQNPQADTEPIFTRDRIRELEMHYREVFDNYHMEYEDKYMNQHREYCDQIQRNIKFLSPTGPQFYNDDYYYYEVLPEYANQTSSPTTNTTENSGQNEETPSTSSDNKTIPQDGVDAEGYINDHRPRRKGRRRRYSYELSQKRRENEMRRKMERRQQGLPEDDENEEKGEKIHKYKRNHRVELMPAPTLPPLPTTLPKPKAIIEAEKKRKENPEEDIILIERRHPKYLHRSQYPPGHPLHDHPDFDEHHPPFPPGHPDHPPPPPDHHDIPDDL